MQTGRPNRLTRPSDGRGSPDRCAGGRTKVRPTRTSRSHQRADDTGAVRRERPVRLADTHQVHRVHIISSSAREWMDMMLTHGHDAYPLEARAGPHGVSTAL